MQGATNTSIPLRKDYRFLKKAQRQRFFYCIKFLSVLPPQEQGNFRKFNVAWKIQNGQRYYKNLSPRNIHDEFISSHQTCCQHGSIYFVYYHRHLMTCFEIALNYAEEVLIGGKGKIPSTLYSPNAKYFDAVFDRYQKIISAYRVQMGLSSTADLPQISAHYWNPVDYTTNISIPQEISQRIPDAMDQLYFAVNLHYPWQFNFATRWFSSDTSQPRLPVNFETMGYFSSVETKYSDAENKIVYGTLNPRSTAQEEFFGVETIDQYGMSFISNTASDINLWKNYKKLKETGSTINICTLDQNELNTLFGSKVKNLHWVSSKQRQNYSIDVSMRAYNYNRSLPHFQFAYALFKKSNIFLKDYISTATVNVDNSMQKSHNTMHNLLQLFMSDSQLSITNPLFFLYHSWIDYQLEVKIRMIRNDPKANKSEYLYAKSFLDTRLKPFSVMDQVSGKGQIRYGDYYVFQWANPATRFYPQFKNPLTKQDYQAAFKTRNFIINDDKQGIRRSDELTAFYKTQYLPTYASKYAYYRNFGKFIFDYNYQIHDYDQKGNRVPIDMKDDVVVVPSYIRAIYDDYDADWNQNRTQNINPPKLNSAVEQEDPKVVAFRNTLQRQVRIMIGGYATYPSSIKSTVIPIQLKITEKGEKFFNLSPEYMQILKRGFVIMDASILSRGVGSELCPNCGDQKEYYIYGSEKIAEMSKELFCQLSRNLVMKTYFKMKNNVVEPIEFVKLNQMLTLTTPRPVFNRLQLIQGTLQADFMIKFKGKQSSSCKVTLSLHSYCVQTNKLQNIIIRKKETIDGTEFQFPRVLSVREGQSHHHYLYRHVQGVIMNGDQRCDFSFDIGTRSRLVSFLILVQEKFDSNNEGYLDVQVVDEHYDLKIKHYDLGDIQHEND